MGKPSSRVEDKALLLRALAEGLQNLTGSANVEKDLHELKTMCPYLQWNYFMCIDNLLKEF